MSTTLTLVLFLGILLFFFLIGFRVSYALGLSAFILMAIGIGMGSINPAMLVSRMFRGINSFTLLCIPLFLLVGKVMNASRMTTYIFDFAEALFGRFRGGLAYVNVVASMIFAGMSGLAIADASGLGPIEFKAMTEKGYDEEYTIGLIGTSALIGPIIPPSMPLVIYAILASVSVGQVLVAGVVPGILIGIILMISVFFDANKYNFPVGEKRPAKEVFSVFLRAIAPLMTIIILIGGMLSGFFTVTETAAVGALYSLILAMLVYRDINFKDLWKIFRTTMMDTATILFLVATAQIYAFLAVRSGLPNLLTESITSITTNPTLVLLIINGVLLIMGCFLDSTAANTLMTPILVPLIKSVGINPVHFGVMMIFNLMIGLLTPPFGTMLFVLNKSCGMDLNRSIRGTVHFYPFILVALLVITLFPQLSLWLVNLVF